MAEVVVDAKKKMETPAKRTIPNKMALSEKRG